jgi:hypothetical protein
LIASSNRRIFIAHINQHDITSPRSFLSRMMPLYCLSSGSAGRKNIFWVELVAHEYNRVSVGKSAHAPHKVYPLSRAPGWLKAFTARVDTMMMY